MRRVLLSVFIWCLPLLYSSSSEYLSAKRKFDLIESEKLKPGSRVSLSAGELNAYAQEEVTTAVPDGIRNPQLQLGSGSASASALINFLKVRRAQGKSPGWIMSKLLDGEREVRVTALIQSGGGRATVDVQKVEISGIPIEGKMLDYLIQNYLLANYPAAKVGEPFELGHHMERLEVKPSAVDVVIGR